MFTNLQEDIENRPISIYIRKMLTKNLTLISILYFYYPRRIHIASGNNKRLSDRVEGYITY